MKALPIVLLSSLILSACSDGPLPADSMKMEDVSTTSQATSTRPVAAIVFRNGSRLEWWEPESGRMMMVEKGMVGVTPNHDAANMEVYTPTQLYSFYTNGSPPPQALVVAERRMRAYFDSISGEPETPAPGDGGGRCPGCKALSPSEDDHEEELLSKNLPMLDGSSYAPDWVDPLWVSEPDAAKGPGSKPMSPPGQPGHCDFNWFYNNACVPKVMDGLNWTAVRSGWFGGYWMKSGGVSLIDLGSCADANGHVLAVNSSTFGGGGAIDIPEGFWSHASTWAPFCGFWEGIFTSCSTMKKGNFRGEILGASASTFHTCGGFMWF